MALPFQGTAYALSAEGLAAVADTLGVFAAEIWTVLSVETSGCGYLSDRRPQILFERHIFHRLTQGQYDANGDISSPTPGGYGSPGRHQYDRLTQAIADDRAAALQSASWGIGQIMGENFAAAGFADVEEMVQAMSGSEDQQLTAISSFMISKKLHVSLQSHDWATFAAGYNGPNYRTNRYDVRLNAEYQKYSAGVMPDINVRAAQLYLTYLGFHPGPVDGIAGERTLAALAQFQASASAATSAGISGDTISELQAALPILS